MFFDDDWFFYRTANDLTAFDGHFFVENRVLNDRAFFNDRFLHDDRVFDASMLSDFNTTEQDAIRRRAF